MLPKNKLHSLGKDSETYYRVAQNKGKPDRADTMVSYGVLLQNSHNSPHIVSLERSLSP